ncbi:hypothetical protein ACFQ4M_05270 [Thauera mechernichensis]|uniref:Nucleotidyltransferase n=1 Tax=Thauera mechernichensis TaxID=82788 RepID=A0ABW3WCP7_9RHOO|nr:MULTISPECIES: hypothetical protein [Thauera]ENO82631.1 hypothetical protein B447_02998 [Thauera sp. 27]MDG3065972.1 hypothetical protein [Thauera mechernichensis]HAG74517.1 hypothetical protein [Thauera sp.]HNS91452.1 hypothetical protein [Thauera sp.]HRK10121.1 hypothetical protein [Thauera sp.]
MPSHAHVSRSGGLRREIAALAARMMAEDGISDFGFAKRKAAKQLGATDADALPNNTEIETELRAWLALYQDEEQPERLHEMRSVAVEVMRLLADFRPYLTGGALDGTAGRYSELEIEIFPESTKDVEIFFLNLDLPYDHREPRRPAPHAPEAVLSFDWNDVPVKVSVYPSSAERNVRRGQERARLAQVEALLAAGEHTTQGTPQE